MKTSKVILVKVGVSGSDLNSPEKTGVQVYLIHKKRHI